MCLWQQLLKDSVAALCIGGVAFFFFNVETSCVFLSRRAVHQHFCVQLPDPGECGEFLWDAVAQFPCTCTHSCAAKVAVVVKSEIVSYCLFNKNLQRRLSGCTNGEAADPFILVEGIFVPLLYWVKVIYIYKYLAIPENILEKWHFFRAFHDVILNP